MGQVAKLNADPLPPQGLALLREPFPPNHISKLPKETGAQSKQRKADQDSGKWPPKCSVCGGYHHPKAVHLDYVGHAALTDRLLDADPLWNWEPMGLNPDGTPALDANGGLWIKLTVCGVTRPGYGSADGKKGGDAIKEIIGDALRNAAMRFGAALDLWHKGDLRADESDDAPATSGESEMPAHEWSKLVQLIEATGADTGAMCKLYGVSNLQQLDQAKYADAIDKLTRKLAAKAKAETDAKASTLAQELGDAINF